MILVGWAVVGVVMGAVGSEVLRARNPKLIKKVEGAAKKLVDSVCPRGSTDQDDASPQEASEQSVEADEQGAGAEEQGQEADEEETA